MKYKSKRGTTINIPDGLSKKEIEAIKKDADSGYGTRAQATADKLGKKLQSKPKDTPTEPVIDNSKLVNPTTGVINTEKSLEAVRKSGDQTITDQFGNKRIIKTDPNTGEVTVVDEAGGTANKFKDLAEAAASTFNGAISRARAEEATYSTLSKNFERDQKREEEAAKQELAQRGIPYDPAAAQDPNTNNLYGKTVGGIGQKYQGYKTDAQNQAILAGNAAYATDSAARDSFLNAVTSGASTFGGQYTPYQGTNSQDTKDIIQLSSAAFLAKYGINKDSYLKEKALNKPSGGSGGGGGGDANGFEILG